MVQIIHTQGVATLFISSSHDDGPTLDRQYQKMGDEYVSYKSPKTIVAETVYHFIRGGIYGAAFGLVTPFHPPGSKAALQEAKTGIFKPARPFSSLASVPHNAIIFGSLLGVQRLGSKTSEYVRNSQDPWNDLFGCAVAYPYYQHFLIKHVKIHNRVVGGAVVLSIAYANLI